LTILTWLNIIAKSITKTVNEGRDHFDPKFEWTANEERKVLRKTEVRVVCVAFFLFFALDMDRGNLSNALSDNFLTELNMSTNDFNLGKTVNLIVFSVPRFLRS
jgi:hypothetical protein